MRKDISSAGLITIYVLIYCILLQFEEAVQYAMIMLFTSPVLIGWMVYTILKHGTYKGAEMGDEEFGYQGKKKEEPGVF
jgi:hypothetical protein